MLWWRALSGKDRNNGLGRCESFWNSNLTEVAEYDELLVRRLIEKVTVYDERFEVEFKSETKVDVKG